ncbi:VacB/RNase II family 3'-5' exoribonuclease [Candidatus Sumerlaeota bacterium]|nr:VacB/RNase II family 3'-5' exoribonuclease [Candidatus Sumerlaeota bacterium]
MKISPESLLSIFEKRPGQPVALRYLMEQVGAPAYQKRLIQQMLLALVHDGRLVRLRNKHYILPAATRTVTGVLQVSLRGAGFLDGAASDGSDLYIHRSNLDTALNGDTVEAEILPDRAGEEGRVVRIVRRAHESIVGQLDRGGRGRGIVTPRNTRINRWIAVSDLPPESEAPDGAWVRVRIVEWSHGIDEPLGGEIEEVLGRAGERGISVLALLRDMGIEIEFPEEVRRQTDALEAPATPDEIARRLDLRDRRIFTIDPATAKDFDDALSVERLDGESWHGHLAHDVEESRAGRPCHGWRLGVHIADVSHYVETDSALDAEALRRGTSIYPVDRVVPMLPERLSNDLCSLNPDADRYAMTVFMDISSEGYVVRREFAESVIRSCHRLNYEEVQEFFDLHDVHPDKTSEVRFASDIGDDLLALRDLARALAKTRIQRGALDLDLGETEVECNPEGDTIGLHRRERLESHRLVEECMLIANETVAQHLRREKVPFLYRIHDLPNPMALEKIAPVLAMFGVHIEGAIQPTPEFYQPIVDRLNRKDGGHIARRLLLRTLKRAEYSAVNRGHFGLASKAYCHFTSPIRRYPDLLVHRVLRAWMRKDAQPRNLLSAEGAIYSSPGQGSDLSAEALAKADATDALGSKRASDSAGADSCGATAAAHARSVTAHEQSPAADDEARAALDRIANQSNLTEGKAFEVEREATNVKSMEFMKDHVGGAFEGWISSIMKRGFFVELVDFPVEGFVRSDSIPGDTFKPDDNQTRTIGRHTRRVYRIGQRVKVVIVRVSEIQGEMDLELREPGPSPRGGKRAKGARKSGTRRT